VGKFPVESPFLDFGLTFSLGRGNFYVLDGILIRIVLLKNFSNRGVARVNY